ncbi:MAG: hypothetical protein J0H74_34650 [Chitinophagaceae bacterium]|nr:hypothetical protein [Chitinophagaceae bacterium]
MKFNLFSAGAIALLCCCLLSSCYKYQKDIPYASLRGSLIDAFTNTKLDYGTVILKPAQLVNGSIYIDTSGNFNNTRIIPGKYTIYGAIANNAAFTSDSAVVDLTGGTPQVDLKVKPFVSIQSHVTEVTDTTIAIAYTIQGNGGLLPSRHGIFYSLTTKPTAKSYTGNPLSYVPAPGQENGSFTYKMTGLTAHTTYHIVVAALAPDNILNPGKNYNQGREMIVTTGVVK